MNVVGFFVVFFLNDYIDFDAYELHEWITFEILDDIHNAEITFKVWENS